MKNNIYDLIISELVANQTDVGGSGGSGGVNSSAAIIITTPGLLNIVANTNTSFDFTSTVYNMPAGYSVQAGSHTVSTVSSGNTVTSTTVNTVSNDIVNIPLVGGTYLVTASITLISSGNPDIVLSTTIEVTAVASVFFGLIPLPSPLVLSTLQSGAIDMGYVIPNTATIGRIIFAVPDTVAAVTRVVDNHGIEMLISEDFVVSAQDSHNVYMLNYDTRILTGSKSFTLKY
jgi:hypothetical protein